MRFHLDENISYEIAAIARRLGVDVTTSQEMGWNSLDDEAQLSLAAAQDRCIVTGDVGDFSSLTLRAMENGWAHRGVLLIPRQVTSAHFALVAQALARFDQEHPDGMLAYEVAWLRLEL